MKWSLWVSMVLLVGCTEATADADDDGAGAGSSSSSAAGGGSTTSGAGGDGGGAGGGAGGGGDGGNGGAPPATFSAAYFAEVNDSFSSWNVLMTDREGQTTAIDLGSQFSLSTLSSLAVSPDGTQMAVVGTDAPSGDVVLRRFPIGADHLPNVAAATDLTTMNPTHGEATIGQMKFSRGGSYIVLRTDHASPNEDWRVYVVPTNGGGLMPIFAGDEVDEAYFASDDQLLVSQGGLCYLATAPIFTPQPLHMDCNDAVFDPQGRLYFHSRITAFGGTEIRRAVNGVVEPQPVPGTIVINEFGDANVDGFALSPQGDRLAFTADEGDGVQLYVVDLATSARTNLTNDMFRGSTSGRDVYWHEETDRIIFDDNGWQSIPASGGQLTELVAGNYLYNSAITSDGSFWFNGPASLSTIEGVYRTSDVQSAIADWDAIEVYEKQDDYLTLFNFVPR